MGKGPSNEVSKIQKRILLNQEEEFRKRREELRLEKEQKAKEATEEFRARRRKQRGRASLIKTSERGVVDEAK